MPRLHLTSPDATHPSPADQGLLGWSYDPVSIVAGFALSAGVLYLLRVIPVRSGSCPGPAISVGTAGVDVTDAAIGLYDAAGARIAVTADIAGTLESTGLKTPNWAQAVQVTAGSVYYVAPLVGSAGTPPVLHLAVGNAVSRAGESAAPFRWCFSGSGLSAVPATVALGSATATDLTYWAAMRA